MCEYRQFLCKKLDRSFRIAACFRIVWTLAFALVRFDDQGYQDTALTTRDYRLVCELCVASHQQFLSVPLAIGPPRVAGNAKGKKKGKNSRAAGAVPCSAIKWYGSRPRYAELRARKGNDAFQQSRATLVPLCQSQSVCCIRAIRAHVYPTHCLASK